MVGGGGAARAGEHAAEGIIAKAAKSVLRDAEGATTRDAARTTAGDAAHHVDLDTLPDWVESGARDPIGARNISEDYQPYGDLSRQEFYDEHWNETKNSWDYPENDGFAGEPRPNTLQAGDTIDRYGSPRGNYTSPADVPFGERALPPTNMTAPYYRYEVVHPLPPGVTEGRIAPAFEQSGGGVQHFFDQPIQYYLDRGYLKQVYP